MNLKVGSIVRIYYDEETFDQGVVCSLTQEHIEVDFYDWIERWPASEMPNFVYMPMYFLHSESCFSPSQPGELVMDFQLTNRTKLLNSGVRIELDEDADAP